MAAVELSINNSHVAGYAFYEDDILVRAVFINSEAFLAGDTSRGCVHIDLNFGGSGFMPRSMFVKRLSIR